MSHFICRLFGHRWVEAGWHAKSCQRCHAHEMWWEL